MKMFRFGMLAAAVASLSVWSAPPVFAASEVMCAPSTVSAAAGPSRKTNPNTNTSYSLDASGCAKIANADVGWFRSQGFVVKAPYGSVTAAGKTAKFTMTLPAGAYIQSVLAQETSGSAMTNGFIIGTTDGGTQVVTGMGLGASAYSLVPETSMGTRVFSATVPQTLYVNPVTTWGSASVNVTIVYGYF